MLNLSIIGAGKLGRTFAYMWHQHGVFQVQQILNRSLASATSAVTMIGAGCAIDELSDLDNSQILMLAVPDDKIAAICLQLAETSKIAPGTIVFHCSGAKASTELQCLADMGAFIASLHPVRSFAEPSVVADSFTGTICSVEGDERALATLVPALEAIAAQVVRINAEHKLLYHAGSVFASNYLVSLMDIAMRSYQAAGISPEIAQAMAEPLARHTLETIFKQGCVKALTGPIARGDRQTVETQMEHVKQWNADAGALYQAFIAPTQGLADKKSI